MKATLKIMQRVKNETKNGKCPVCLQYTSYRKTTYIGLGISVEPKHWSDNKKMVLSGEKFHLQYNRIIKKQCNKANRIIFDHFTQPLPVSAFICKFKDKFYGNTDFYVFIENELEFLKLSRSNGTIDNYRNLINKMKEWKPTLLFSEITLEYIQRFHDHEIKTGNQLSTIYKKHANFKFLLSLAVDKDLMNKNPYNKFKIKKITQAQNRDVLNEEELRILQDAYNEGKYEGGKREVLRNFLFSCYTSLSYAEFHNVVYSDLKVILLNEENNGAFYLLCNERLKTKVMYKIPIVSLTVRSLLEIENKESFQNIFHPLSNSLTNKYLSDIMKELNINKKMTFHRARHTFRTIAAKKGVRDCIAERIMGHAIGNNIQDIYMHLDDEDIVAEMQAKWVVTI